MTISLSRRHLIQSAGVAGAVSALPGFALAAAPTSKRLVFIIQRGAADGLALLPPLGDPDLKRLRGGLMDDDPMRLTDMFGLHPSFENLRELFGKGEARAHHAVATSYRDRSHFDGQNILESGAGRPYAEDTGWLGRLRTMLPQNSGDALALASAVPLAMRGQKPVATFSANSLPDASEDLLLRLSGLYEADPMLAPLWAEALKTKDLAGDISGNNGRNGGQLGELAARLLAPENGARILMVETGGWDTHSNQKGRLAGQLRGLDLMLAGLKTGLGPLWQETLVVVATEFGRTAAVNGTAGTDHGTASAMFFAGGGLPEGPPVIADWPGLSDAALFQGRDLKPTADMGSIITASLAQHYGMAKSQLTGLFHG